MFDQISLSSSAFLWKKALVVWVQTLNLWNCTLLVSPFINFFNMAKKSIIVKVEKLLELSQYSNFFVFKIFFVSVVFVISVFVSWINTFACMWNCFYNVPYEKKSFDIFRNVFIMIKLGKANSWSEYHFWQTIFERFSVFWGFLV